MARHYGESDLIKIEMAHVWLILCVWGVGILLSTLAFFVEYNRKGKVERAAQEIMRMQRVARCLRNRDYSKHRYLYSRRSELNQNEGVIVPRSPTMDEDGKTQDDTMGPTEQNNLTAGETAREEMANLDRIELVASSVVVVETHE